ncbi:MAG: hypothetical protein SP1CHLAM42_06900 [Chlamydiales bacterium]|nr:hypothetical protein [Chlamydiales bacterium]
METLNNSHPASSAIIFDSALFLTRLTSKWLELVLEFSRIKNSDEICQTVVNQYLLMDRLGRRCYHRSIFRATFQLCPLLVKM